MSKFKKRALMVMGSVILVTIVLGVFSIRGNNPVADAVNTIFSPVQSLTVKIARPVRNFVSYLTQMKEYKEENERLKSELETLKKENRNQEEYKKENNRLKKILQLTDDLANCETVPAKIIAFEPGNWFHSLVINKGKNDGIKVSDVVITSAGVVGKVTEVGINWSRVSTLLDTANSLGIKMTRTGDVGIVEGDAELLKKRCFKLDYIAKNTSVIMGDVLETSGLGGIYPPGLAVGTIEEIMLDNTGELVKAIVKPAVDFDALYEVVVVTYWEPAVYDREKVMIEYLDEIAREERDTARENKSLKSVVEEGNPTENDVENSMSTPKPTPTPDPEEGAYIDNPIGSIFQEDDGQGEDIE